MSNMRVGSGQRPQQRQTVQRQPERQPGRSAGQQPTANGSRSGQFRRDPFYPDFARMAGLQQDGSQDQSRRNNETERVRPEDKTLNGADNAWQQANASGRKDRGGNEPVRETGKTGSAQASAERSENRPGESRRTAASEDGKQGTEAAARTSAPEKTGKAEKAEKTEKAGGKKDWDKRINGLFKPKTTAEWKQRIQQWGNRIKDLFGNILQSVRRGIAGPFRNQMAQNNGWASNVLFVGSSNSEHTVGWMRPGGKTAMGYALSRHLPNAPSLVDGMNRFSGRPYPGFPGNAISKYWRADKVGSDDYFQSPLRFSKNTQNGPNPTKNVFVGISGGPEGAFARSIHDVGKIMERDFNADSFVYHRGIGRADQHIAHAFGKIREYALKNPDKPVSVAFMLDTHGNTSGGSRRVEGAGHGYTGQVNEQTLKNLVNRYLGGLDNVGVHVIVSACHSGAYLM